MVEIIKDVKELNKNVTLALNSDNKYLTSEYDSFRKKVAKVLNNFFIWEALYICVSLYIVSLNLGYIYFIFGIF